MIWGGGDDKPASQIWSKRERLFQRVVHTHRKEKEHFRIGRDDQRKSRKPCTKKEPPCAIRSGFGEKTVLREKRSFRELLDKDLESEKRRRY